MEHPWIAPVVQLVSSTTLMPSIRVTIVVSVLKHILNQRISIDAFKLGPGV
jgi:hypothetical protein